MKTPEKENHVLLLLDGEEPSKEFTHQFLSCCGMIIATDGAAKYAHSHDIPLDLIIGDMDSLPKDIIKQYEEKGTPVLKEDEQYSNDFEKALRYILAETPYKDVIVLGIHGKRTDHLLTNFSVMLRYTDQFDTLVAYDLTHEHHFLSEDKHWHSFNLPIGTLVSITPLPEAVGVNTVGLYYPIKKMKMVFGQHEGLSNIISEEDASVEIAKGALLISIPISQ